MDIIEKHTSLTWILHFSLFGLTAVKSFQVEYPTVISSVNASVLRKHGILF